MLRDSQLLQSLQMFPFDLHGQPMCIYGDPAYPLRIHLQALFHNRVFTPQMQAYNAAMGEVCSSVSSIVSSFWTQKKNLKIGLSSVRKMYVVGALLRNAPNAPKKSVKIQHLLHLRVPIVESQKW